MAAAAASHRRAWWPLALVVVLLSLTGCGAPQDPLDRTVDARSAKAWRHWLLEEGSALGPGVERELLAAVEQLKLREQLQQAGRSPETIAAMVRRKIHGLTAREVITQAHLWTWRYLDQQNTLDDFLFERNATAPLTPDADDAIVARFRDQLHDIRLRQEQRRLQMRHLEQRLEELNPGNDLLRVLRPPETAPGTAADRVL